MAHACSFIQKFRVALATALIVIANLAFAGCTLNRSALGCVPDEVGDDTGRCRLVSADASADAFVHPGDAGDAEIDSGFDAGEMPDGDLSDSGSEDSGLDAGHDGGPPSMDGGFDAGRDAGTDAGTDACVPVVEICGDGIDQDCSGGDLPCPLLIRMDGAVPMTGIAIRLIWNELPPFGRQERGWFFTSCVGGPRMVDADTVECAFTHPDLASGRQLEWFPFDTGTMTSRCTRVTCPGMHTATYLGAPAVPVVTFPDAYDANGNMIVDAADRAALHVEGLP